MPTEAEIAALKANLQGFSDDELKQYADLMNGVIDNVRYNIDTKDFFRADAIDGIVNNNERFLKELEKDFNNINSAVKSAGSFVNAPEQKIKKDGVWDKETAERAVSLHNYLFEIGGDAIAIRNRYEDIADRARDWGRHLIAQRATTERLPVPRLLCQRKRVVAAGFDGHVEPDADFCPEERKPVRQAVRTLHLFQHIRDPLVLLGCGVHHRGDLR